MPEKDTTPAVRRCPFCSAIIVCKQTEKKFNADKRVFCNRACVVAFRVASQPVADRFAKYVDRPTGQDSCWMWTGYRNNRGYGQFRVDGRTYGAHRVSIGLAGVHVTNDKYVLHSCDNPPCVNPAHLRVGTARDNVQDCLDRGRHVSPRGTKHGHSKLTEDDVIEIRIRYDAGGVSQAALGSQFGVSQVNISRIVLRRAWAHV